MFSTVLITCSLSVLRYGMWLIDSSVVFKFIRWRQYCLYAGSSVLWNTGTRILQDYPIYQTVSLNSRCHKIFEVSRSPKVGLPISRNLGVRKSDSQYQE